MRFFKAIIYSLLIIICFHIFLADTIHASEDFSISGESSYVVNQSGETKVEHRLSLENKKIDVYATQYALSVASTRINNVWAEDKSSKLSPKVNTSSNKTLINIDFIHKSVGKGQVLDFTVGYDDKDVAQKIGRIWEVNISQPENLYEFKDYDIFLYIPNDFEDPMLVIPENFNKYNSDEYTVYQFSKNSLSEKGITAIFGKNQVFSFDIRYTLKNPNPIKKYVEIAIPPDTFFQKIFYNKISPEPIDIRMDSDGNWLAKFLLNSRETKEVHTIGHVVLSLNPEYKKKLSNSNLSQYLKSQAPWQTEDPTIKDLALKLKTPKNIYQYVVDNLSYNFERVAESNKRLGAIGALSAPDQAICMEFTDLFIAISRSSGIPAREINGFAYTNNPVLRPLSLKQDILHSWPEYFSYEIGAWIPVDPTWENTTEGIDYFSKFDLNHFVFVIHGSDAELPFPPGYYRTKKQKGKDIIIVPSENVPQPTEQYSIEFNVPDKITAGLPVKSNILVKNTGNVSLDNLKINLSSNNIKILSNKNFEFENFLPYSNREVEITLFSSNIFNYLDAKINVLVNNSFEDEKNISIEPIQKRWKEAGILILLASLFAFGAKKTRGLFLSLKKK